MSSVLEMMISDDPVGVFVRYFFTCWAVHGVVSLVSSLIVPSYYNPTVSFEKRISWDYTVSSVIYCVPITTFYLLAVLEFHGSVEDRWTGVSFFTVHGIALHAASSLYESVNYVLTGKEWLFYAHHVVTLGCCVSMLFTERGQFWCSVLGLVEATNIPLGMITVLGSTPKLRNSLVYVLNGILLWLLYLLLRLPIPVAMYFLARDLWTQGPESGGPAWVFEDATMQTCWVVFLFTSGSFLWLLSMFWLKKITAGVVKGLKSAGILPK
mmetsp:Transcript_4968/g.11698  ORF Transcript_4968/g.11698 Transcript_4968/m.11698 type:complete len:267 (+) Transcript_4968:132-932(+)